VRPGRLGDLLLADPLVAALAERWPDASLELVTDASDRVPPWMLGGKIARRTLALRRGPDAWRRPSDPERAASLSALGRDWSAHPPDLLLFAMDLADPVQRALAAELAAAAPQAWRAGLASVGHALPELHAAVDPGPATVHESERLLRLAARVGADGRFRFPRLPRAPSPLGSWGGPTVVVHPGASRSTKRWPLARWGELAARLTEVEARTVVVGDRAERAHLPALGIPFDERTFVDRVGMLDLAELAAAIAGADAFAGNDSFPFHLAAAAGVPALALVGPGALRWTAWPAPRVTVARAPVLCSPRHGEECPVYTTCPHGACMQSIRVEAVAAALLGALAAPAAVPGRT
jgi:ADP-heptose:LPS heptosyltransferase